MSLRPHSVAVRMGKCKLLENGCPQEIVNKFKSTVRAKAEHPFIEFKRWLGFG